jgi:hypothetical protein
MCLWKAGRLLIKPDAGQMAEAWEIVKLLCVSVVAQNLLLAIAAQGMKYDVSKAGRS